MLFSSTYPNKEAFRFYHVFTFITFSLCNTKFYFCEKTMTEYVRIICFICYLNHYSSVIFYGFFTSLFSPLFSNVGTFFVLFAVRDSSKDSNKDRRKCTSLILHNEVCILSAFLSFRIISKFGNIYQDILKFRHEFYIKSLLNHV